MVVQRANPYGLPWSGWISPKTNAVELLSRAADRGRLAGARIFCASSTDPYTPIERRFGLTRGCLEVMARAPPAALLLQTRSPLVVRDLDLLRKIPSLVVSVTLTTDDEKVRRALEPDSPSIAARIKTLDRLRKAGIRTQAAISPLLPCDPDRLARLLDPVVTRVVLDDFFSGDGAGGRRSEAALSRLRALGYEAWTEPGYAEEAEGLLRRRLGPDRVGISAEGFSAGLPDRVPATPADNPARQGTP